mmetsp:Transcript_50739/g.149610  ORF Transcript_50739/g.149610 Transcript_50739/m.149610 type:complete len:394 (+) Transcript_50739:1127-2308(+)
MSDKHAQGVIRCHSQLPLVPIWPGDHLQEALREQGEMLREHRRRRSLNTQRLRLSQNLNHPADVCGYSRDISQLLAEDRHQLLHGHDRRVELGDAAQRPSDGVTHGHVGVAQRRHHGPEALRDERHQLLARRALHDGSVSEHRCVPALPVRVLEVLPDEREHRVDAAIADHLCHKPQAGPGRHGQVPRVVVLLVSALCQRLGEQRDQVSQGLLDEVERDPVAILPALGEIQQVEFLVAHRRPELHGRDRDLLRSRSDRLPGQGADGVHIRHHEVVVLRRNLHQGFEGCNLHVLRRGELAALVQGDLHEEVSLMVAAEGPLSQDHRVVERPRGGQLGVDISVAHALDDGREHVVGDLVVDLRALLLEKNQLLAEVAQGDERNLPRASVRVGDVL